MKEITVLLPVDYSEGSKLAVKTALKLAEAADAHFILLTCIEAMTRLKSYEQMDSVLREKMEAAAHSFHEELKEKYPALKMSSKIVVGRPGEMIIDFIEHNQVDLVIMATQNSSKVKRLIIGSVTNYVLNHSKIPVLALPIRDLAEN